MQNRKHTLTLHVAPKPRRVLQEQAQAPGALLGPLSTLLSAHDAVAALQQRSLRGTLALLCQLGVQLARAWRAAGGATDDDFLAAHPGAPQVVVVALNAPPPATTDAAPPEGGAASEQDGELAALRARQEELLQELADAADVLRFWSRRSEKAAAGEAAVGREGDVPSMLAEVRVLGGMRWARAGAGGCMQAHSRGGTALPPLPYDPPPQAQQLLWGACHAYDDAQRGDDVRTRQLVCQRYRPLDVPGLQARADDYTDGDRVKAQPSLTYEPEFVELRGRARAAAAQLLAGVGHRRGRRGGRVC